METEQAFDTTTASLAEKPASRFTLQHLSEVDEVKEYREAAEKMLLVDHFYDLAPADVHKMVKALETKWGPRTASVKTMKSGLKRVRRVAERPLVPRKPKAAKAVVPAKKAKGKPDA